MNGWQKFVLPICVLTAMLFYGNTTSNQIALDDTMVLSSNTFVKEGFSGIPDIFSHDSFYGATRKAATQLSWRYRPLSLAFFAVIYEFTGPDWRVFHTFCILLYGLCGWAAYRALRILLFRENPAAALFTTLLFMILPVHTEVVANIKSCDEQLALLFTLLFLGEAGKSLINKAARTSALSLLWFVLALFSKESSVTNVVLLPLILFAGGLNARHILRSSWPHLLAVVLFALLRLQISTVPDPVAEIPSDPYILATGEQKIATVLFVLLEYLRLMVWPVPMIFDYGYNHIPYRDFGNAWVWVSLLLHLLLLTAGVALTLRRKMAGVFLLGYLGGIVLLSNLFVNVGPLMAERFLFSPGFFLLGGTTALIMQMIPKKGAAVLGGICLISTVPAWQATTTRNREWKDNSTLYAADVEKAPESFRVQAFMGMTITAEAEQISDSTTRAGRLTEGLKHFRKAWSIYPGYKMMYKEWGYSYYLLDKLDSAEWAWSRFRELNPGSPTIALNESLLADAYYRRWMIKYNQRYQTGNLPELSRILQQALRYKPDDVNALGLLAKVHFLAGNSDSAIACWEHALSVDTTLTEVRGYLRDYGKK